MGPNILPYSMLKRMSRVCCRDGLGGRCMPCILFAASSTELVVVGRSGASPLTWVHTRTSCQGLNIPAIQPITDSILFIRGTSLANQMTNVRQTAASAAACHFLPNLILASAHVLEKLEAPSINPSPPLSNHLQFHALL
jgi:hypothetical protein